MILIVQMLKQLIRVIDVILYFFKTAQGATRTIAFVSHLLLVGLLPNCNCSHHFHVGKISGGKDLQDLGMFNGCRSVSSIM